MKRFKNRGQEGGPPSEHTLERLLLSMSTKPVEVIPAHDFIIHNEQVFHFKNTYTYIWEWLKEEGFEGLYDESNGERIEFYYDEKRPQPGMREIRIWWRTAMVPDGNPYYRYRLDFFYEILHMKKTEIIFEGRKATADDGEMILIIKSYLELDYKDLWKKHPFLKLWDQFFRRRIYKENIEQYKQDLIRRSTRLQEDIKRILELQEYERVPERFHVQRGL